MVDSTELRGRLGTERFEALSDQHDAVLVAAIARHGGELMRGTGDGLWSVFPSAASAVEAAADMQRAIHEHAQLSAMRLAIRIGVSAGDVEWQGDQAQGKALVEGARLEVLAGAGGIAVSDVAAALARERARVSFGRRRTGKAKGLAEPLGYTDVLWGELSSTPALLDLAEPGIAAERIFGRDHELAVLDHAWSTLGTRRRLVVIRGDAGIGKTELARTFCARLHGRGRWVMQGRCDARELVPFQPFAEMLAFLFDHLPDGQALRQQWGEPLAPLVPGLVSSASSASRLDEADRYRLFESVSAFYEMLSLGHPIVLMLDDLGGADRQTLELLEFLVRRPGDGSILMVATARRSQAEHSDGFAAFSKNLSRAPGEMTTIDLGGIDVDAVGALVAHETGLPPAMTAGALADYLADYTGGNPLHLKAVVANVSPGVLVDLAAGLYRSDRPSLIDVPTAVIDDIRRVHQELDDAGRAVIEAGAVIGYRFRPGLVQEVVGLDDQAMDQALEDAMSRGVVVLTGQQPLEFRFSHPLVHDATLAIIDFRRARLHTLVGRTMRRSEPDAETRLARELSLHLSYSQLREEQLDAARFAEIAARQAGASFAHGVAATQYQRALDLYASANEVLPAVKQFRLLFELGRAQRNAGDPRARTTLARAAEHAERNGDGHGMAAALLAGQPGQWSLTGDIDHARIRLIDRALALVGEESSSDRASLLGAKSAELTFADDAEQRAERGRLSREAIEMAPRGSDPRTRYKVLELRDSVLRHPDGLAEREQIIAEMEELTADGRSPAQQFGAASLGYWTAVEARSGRLRKKRLEVMESIAGQLDHPRLVCLLTHWQGVEAALGGRFEAALDRANRTYYMMKALGEADAEIWYIGARYIPYRFLGRLDELVPDLESRITAAPGWVGMRAGLALAHAYGGRLKASRQVLDTIHIDRIIDQANHHDRMANMALVADTLARLDEHPQRERLCEVMKDWADRNAFNGSACFGAVAHYRGLLLRALQRPGQAVEAFELAELMNRELGAPALLAESQVELADALLQSGARGADDRVRGLLDEAANVAGELGLHVVERRRAEVAAQFLELVADR